jgi:2-keto-4-pentenoate hydratase/2-oxohepta-3-ene-1,7-dioic acid hydratase in catechol pathway
VSRGEDVWPGDVYGSGTAFGGCGLDLDRWIAPGDVIALEVEGIGVLQNRVVR